MKNVIGELIELAAFLRGCSHMAHNPDAAEDFSKASVWLGRLAKNVCGQGYFGCNGGENCQSSHK